MSKRLFVIALAAFLIAGIAEPVWAWNPFGHMTVAYLAYQKLTPATRDRANALLKLNPRYNDWLQTLPAGTSPADRDLMIFMIASTWPDQIKGDSSYTKDGSQNGNRPDGSPDPTRNTGYDDKLMHKYWHFVDMPFTSDQTALPAIPTPNAQTQIATFRGVLASNSGDDLKSYDLSWLLHLVGDVHQPLHCATRVSSGETSGDNGGNNVKLSCSGCGSELHAFWDDVLGTSTSPASAITFAKTLPAANKTSATKSDENVWIAESFSNAKQKVYVAPVGAGDGPFSLTPKYKTAAKALAKKRVELAGVRLANLLNNELQ